MRIIEIIKSLFKGHDGSQSAQLPIPPQIETTPKIEQEWSLMMNRIKQARQKLILAERKRVDKLNNTCPKCKSLKVTKCEKNIKDVMGGMFEYLKHFNPCKFRMDGSEDLSMIHCDCGHEWPETFEDKTVGKNMSWADFITELGDKKRGKILKNKVVAGISLDTIHYLFQLYASRGLCMADWNTPEYPITYTCLYSRYEPINAIQYNGVDYYDESKFDPEYLKGLGAVD